MKDQFGKVLLGSPPKNIQITENNTKTQALPKQQQQQQQQQE
jgi:hypothetical protein